ncbi:alpha-glucosidase [Novosphingobium sp.]|uniref:alpha-glucosidase n=1 Tax=Novosphingobium sp. TaxID=1874826 RepID=UPI0031D01D5D
MTIRSLLTCAMLACLLISPRSGVAASARADVRPWWEHAAIYEIYIRSFQDSNGDGIGDLNGITRRLDYLQRLGVDAIWITPFYPSPNKDFGYDVKDYVSIAPEYGSMADFARLVKEARRRRIRVLVDFVVNHSSDQHPWFKESIGSRHSAKRDWYIWRDGTPDGGPPNNWRSIFGGPAWTKDVTSGQWYYHIFLPEQPDLNWRNPAVQQAMFQVMKFWLDRGVAGFRLDATPYLVENADFADDPDIDHGQPVGLKGYNSDHPETHAILRAMRKVVDSRSGGAILLGESATATIEQLAAEYGARGDEITLPMNFLYGDLRKLDPLVMQHQIDDAQTRLNGRPPVMFFSSHDHNRQWSQFGDGLHNDLIAKLTATMTLAQKGVALLYYGEEIGMHDASPQTLAASPLGPRRPVADRRDVARTPMQWSGRSYGGFSDVRPWLDSDPNQTGYDVVSEVYQKGSILEWYRDLLGLRRHNPVFRDGEFVQLAASDKAVVTFGRRLTDGRGAIVLLNCSDRSTDVVVSGWPGRWRVLHSLLSTHGGLLRRGHAFRLKPYQSLLVSVKSE